MNSSKTWTSTEPDPGTHKNTDRSALGKTVRQK